MLDFLLISTKSSKRGMIEIYPHYKCRKSHDLMIRGGDFYAIWLDDAGKWSTDEQDAIDLIDRELDIFAEKNRDKFDGTVKVEHLWDSENGRIDKWHNYCRRQALNSFVSLDEKLVFANDPISKKDYSSKRLPYPLADGNRDSYEKLMSTLYTEEERHKIEWAIGAIVTGASKKLQKFIVLYGAAGTGKSTVINIIEKLFEGYCSVFDAKALGSNKDAFSLEAFSSNPLVAIQHDGDLSRIEDNTKLNSLVSHESMRVNEKYMKTYSNSFKAFLIMGTNKPVKITDAKSGLLRRLIDVTPSGNKLPRKTYDELKEKIDFELGAIAWHCREVFLKDPHYYDAYVPVSMLSSTNDFYNYVVELYFLFSNSDGITLAEAWEHYKEYCDDSNSIQMKRIIFKEELKNYFEEYCDRYTLEDGSRVRSYYKGFRLDKIEGVTEVKQEPKKDDIWLKFDSETSYFDEYCKDELAQYAKENGTPKKSWEYVSSKLSDIDTSKLHYVQISDIQHIVIDFDIKDENGNKCLEKNIEAANKFPPTYAELSKSGGGIHLHYIYKGDAEQLCRIYDDHIEIKVFTGKAPLRRMLTKCNSLPISDISAGLPIKETKMISTKTIENERMLRALIKKNLDKKVHGNTKQSINFIDHLLNEAYDSGMSYDVTNMRNAIIAFAGASSNNKDYCLKVAHNMRFRSDDIKENEDIDNVVDNSETVEQIVFYDVEVFPNLFIICWKFMDEDGKPPKQVSRMINPSAEEVKKLVRFKLIGFNCRRYDNHILYARMLGYSLEQLYLLSKAIIDGNNNVLFGKAYSLSYTDVFDFAATKQSLKKWEIELGIHHKELGLPWNKPVPEEMWLKVAEYCDNDVIATEATFKHLKADWTARQILADLSGLSVNDKTNKLTAKIIFGNDNNPQKKFIYRNLAEPVFELDDDILDFLKETFPEMMVQRHGKAGSLLPYFESYKHENGKSTYRGENISEGGQTFSIPGMYGNVALLDIVSMHPHSALLEVIFGLLYTKRFKDILQARVYIKHKEFDKAGKLLDGLLNPYIEKVKAGEISSKDLAYAIKIAINMVYGMTSAGFDNLFKDPRNIDNIVAKRGALFMVDLKHEVQARGFTVVHIKTDSIKIADATPEIIEFVMNFGKRYGYTFEHEATYEKMCIVNKAAYIAKYKEPEKDENGNDIWWTATATEFQIPYVFKKCFSKEKITFNDYCCTFAVTKGDLYLDMNEDIPQLPPEEAKELETIEKLLNSKDEEKIQKYLTRKGIDSDYLGERYSQLTEKEKLTHNYQFIGKVGSFVPVKSGGGELFRIQDGKPYAATGSSKKRWLEAEVVKTLNLEDNIDISYFDALMNTAIEDIEFHCDFHWFASDAPYIMHGTYEWNDEYGLYSPLYEEQVPFR